MITLEKFKQALLAHLFTSIGVTEGQYRFKGRTSPGQEQEVANAIIYSATGEAMEYRNLIKYDQHKNSGGTNLQTNWEGCHKAWAKYSGGLTLFSSLNMTI